MTNGTLLEGDCLQRLHELEDDSFQAIVADPPYFQVLLGEDWDNQWQSEEAYRDWFSRWVALAGTKLREDGLFYIFGQLGKREHVWLHVCAQSVQQLQFHDMLIWDRAVGYNERYDSFTPCYEMVLVLRKHREAKPYFDKDAVRLPYEPSVISTYLKDNRYKDLEARKIHLEKGKYATNILRVPSLKGQSREKIGHPSQKPIKLIRDLIRCATKPGDQVLDPFMGSGTTAEACEELGRTWVGIEALPKYVEMTNQRLALMRQEMELFHH